jgi:hypothetical protein
MFVVLDDNNYVKFLSTTTKMEGSIELPDDDSLNLTYLTCYKLNSEGNGLMLDAEKVEAQKDRLGVASKIFDLKQQLQESDFKVLRKIREESLGIETHLSNEEYLQLEAERESITRQIRELEDGETLVTDISEILKEGEEARKAKEEQIAEIKDAINNIIPEIEKSINEIVAGIEDGTLVQEVFEKVKEYLSELFNWGDIFGSKTEGNEEETSGDSSQSDAEKQLSDFFEKLKDKLSGKDQNTAENEDGEKTESPSGEENSSNQNTESTSNAQTDVTEPISEETKETNKTDK